MELEAWPTWERMLYVRMSPMFTEMYVHIVVCLSCVCCLWVLILFAWNSIPKDTYVMRRFEVQYDGVQHEAMQGKALSWTKHSTAFVCVCVRACNTQCDALQLIYTGMLRNGIFMCMFVYVYMCLVFCIHIFMNICIYISISMYV